MNPYYIEKTIAERRREMLAESERLRLVALYNAHNPGPVNRLLLALGEMLIRLGENLKRRHGQPADMEDKLCRE